MAQDPVIQYATTSDGVRIAWYAMGDGVPFVACSDLQWSHLRNPLPFREYHRSKSGKGLGRGLRIVRYDARGTGLSDRNALDFSLDAQERDLDAVLAAAGIDRFVLFGRAHGSPLAASYASRHPDRIQRLVLMMPYACGRDLPPLDQTLGMTMLPAMTEKQWVAPEGAPALDTGAIDRVPLTPREDDVLLLLVNGRSNREIADELGLGERTVARHIANIYEKTGVHSRAEITAYAVRHRLI